jgi:hypothetical protein
VWVEASLKVAYSSRVCDQYLVCWPLQGFVMQFVMLNCYHACYNAC